MATHRERCEKEMTRDVIFLFQRRDLKIIGMPDGFDMDADGGITQTHDDDGELTEPVEWTARQLYSIGLTHGDYDVPCVIEHWHTESVWLDRDEAEAWGRSHDYRFADGWRVYGVCAEGELAKMLRGET
jgi:hypothetical protein